jgi:hypothetical protein
VDTQFTHLAAYRRRIAEQSGFHPDDPGDNSLPPHRIGKPL